MKFSEKGLLCMSQRDWKGNRGNEEQRKDRNEIATDRTKWMGTCKYFATRESLSDRNVGHWVNCSLVC